MNPDEEICIVKWTTRDLVNAFLGIDVEPTEEALSTVIELIKADLADVTIERGWEFIEEVISLKPWLNE